MLRHLALSLSLSLAIHSRYTHTLPIGQILHHNHHRWLLVRAFIHSVLLPYVHVPSQLIGPRQSDERNLGSRQRILDVQAGLEDDTGGLRWIPRWQQDRCSILHLLIRRVSMLLLLVVGTTMVGTGHGDCAILYFFWAINRNSSDFNGTLGCETTLLSVCRWFGSKTSNTPGKMRSGMVGDRSKCCLSLSLQY